MKKLADTQKEVRKFIKQARIKGYPAVGVLLNVGGRKKYSVATYGRPHTREKRFRVIGRM